MLVSFTIEPRAFQLAHLDRGQQLNALSQLAEQWLKYGVFVSDPAIIIEELSGLSPDLKKRWEELLMAAKMRNRVNAFVGWRQESFASPSDLMNSFGAAIELACIDSRSCITYGLSVDEPCKSGHLTSPEVCRVDCAASASSFSRIRGSESGQWKVGLLCEDAISSTLLPLARLHHSLTVVDHYALSGNDLTNCGLRKFLVSVNRLEKKTRVEILCGAPPGIDPDSLAKMCVAMGRQLKWVEATLYVCQADAWDKAHPRFIRYGIDVCIVVDKGLAGLNNVEVEQLTPYSIHRDVNLYVDVEKMLKARAIGKTRFGRSNTALA
jgi:hypothetical protein